MTFPGAEAALVPWYTARLTGARVVTETPADLQTVTPVLRVVSVGGASDPSLPTRFRLIRWMVQCYAVGAVDTLTFAEQVHALTMGALRGSALTGADVTFVGHDSGPSWTPYLDPQVRQYVVGYNARLLLH